MITLALNLPYPWNMTDYECCSKANKDVDPRTHPTWQNYQGITFIILPRDAYPAPFTPCSSICIRWSDHRWSGETRLFTPGRHAFKMLWPFVIEYWFPHTISHFASVVHVASHVFDYLGFKDQVPYNLHIVITSSQCCWFEIVPCENQTYLKNINVL